MAWRHQLGLGSKITIISPDGPDTVIGNAPRIRDYPVVAIFKVGMSDYDSNVVYMPMKQAEDLFGDPLHPYTEGLMASIPRLELMRGGTGETKRRLQEIAGIVPALTNLPAGCSFAPRCDRARRRDARAVPAWPRSSAPAPGRDSARSTHISGRGGWRSSVGRTAGTASRAKIGKLLSILVFVGLVGDCA